VKAIEQIHYQIVTYDQLQAVHDALLQRSRESAYPSAMHAYEDAWLLIADVMGLEMETGGIVLVKTVNSTADSRVG
jgi:hypothetical protein